MDELQDDSNARDALALVPAEGRLPPHKPFHWDYDESVKRVKQTIYKWKNITLEIADELYTAQQMLSTGGRPKSGEQSWASYCEDVGIAKSTANRWLARIFHPSESGANAPLSLPAAAAIGTYRTVILDPPWPMTPLHRDIAVEDDRVTLDYPTQTIDEIRESPAWDHVAADGCHIYLWTTQRFLHDAWHLLEDKDIKPEVTLVWHKSSGFTPFSFMYNAEFVVFGRTASLPLLKLGEKVVFQGKVREHSRKPDEFYDLVRLVSPEPRIDCHSREPRDGFDQWGNQTEYFT